MKVYVNALVVGDRLSFDALMLLVGSQYGCSACKPFHSG